MKISYVIFVFKISAGLAMTLIGSMTIWQVLPSPALLSVATSKP